MNVVERNADIFVLIVGSRYGSPAGEGKSVTNLEYLTARSKGIPVFVFVARNVLEILPVWKANRDGNYSQITDSPKLFEFVSSLMERDAGWVFPFDIAQQIFDALRLQLSYLFMDALALRLRLGAGGLPPKFRDLPGTQLRLVVERPPGWEYLLFSHALTHEIAALADVRRDWQYGIAVGPSTCMTPKAFTKWVPSKTDEGLRFATIAERILNEALPHAFGAPGTHGDAEAILYGARRLAGVYRSAMDWRLDFVKVKVPEELIKLKAATARLCDGVVPDIEEFSLKLQHDLKQAIVDCAIRQKG